MLKDDSIEKFVKLSAILSVCVLEILKAEELLIELMCEHGDIPIGIKEKMISHMNKKMGITKLPVDN